MFVCRVNSRHDNRRKSHHRNGSDPSADDRLHLQATAFGRHIGRRPRAVCHARNHIAAARSPSRQVQSKIQCCRGQRMASQQLPMKRSSKAGGWRGARSIPASSGALRPSSAVSASPKQQARNNDQRINITRRTVRQKNHQNGSRHHSPSCSPEQRQISRGRTGRAR